jgi:hypothetical protein
MNDMYDEAVEVSQSLDQGAFSAPPSKPSFAMNKDEKASSRNDAKDYRDAKSSQPTQGLRKDTEQTRSQTINNQLFDEALEFSHSGSDESVDTTAKGKAPNKQTLAPNTATFAQQQHAQAQAQVSQKLQPQPQSQQPPSIQNQAQKKYQEVR